MDGLKRFVQILENGVAMTRSNPIENANRIYLFSKDFPTFDITIRNNSDVSANIPPVFCECSLPNKSSVLQILHKCSASVPRVFLRILQRVNNILQSCSPVKSCRGFFYHSWQVYSWLTDFFPPLGSESKTAFLFTRDTRKFSSNFDDFLIFSTKYARQEMIKFTNYIKYLFPIFTHGFPFRGNLATGQHLLQHHRVQDGVSLIRSYPSYSTFNYLTDSQEVEHD